MRKQTKGAIIYTSTAMQSLSVCRTGDERLGGAGKVTKRKSDGNRCSDSTYGGRPPSAKVAAVWWRVELSHLLKRHTQQENGTQRKEICISLLWQRYFRYHGFFKIKNGVQTRENTQAKEAETSTQTITINSHEHRDTHILNLPLLGALTRYQT